MTMNPLTAIKRWYLRRSGQRKQAELVRQLTAELERMQAEILASGRADRVRYFVSYAISRTQHYNSPPGAQRANIGYGMGMVDMNGPIDCWDKVMAVQAQFTLNAMKDGIPNPQVAIINFQEVARVRD